MGSWTHPVLESQLSAVQASSSSQDTAVPLHTNESQTSSSVQASPSSQGSLLAVWEQAPVSGSQVSSEQTFPSSQSFAVPPSQVPAPSHVSGASVQALPSSQVVPWSRSQDVHELELIMEQAWNTQPSRPYSAQGVIEMHWAG